MEDNYIIAPVVHEDGVDKVYEPIVKITDTLPIGTEVDYDGENIPSGWEEIGDTVQATIGTTNPNNDRVWFKQSKNLFNKNNILSGYYIDASGNLVAAADNYVGNDFIKIDNTKTYYISGGQNNAIRICYYTTSQTFISRELITNAGALTIPNNAIYVKISSYTSNLSTTQLEQNSTATTYEAYITPSINVDNEEIYSKPVVLYDTPTTNTSIELNDNINNYNYYEIIFHRGSGYSSVRMPTTQLTNISLMTGQFASDLYRLYNANISISGTTLTKNYARYVNFTTNSCSSADDISNFYIDKVIGYN